MDATRFSPPYAPPSNVVGIIQKWREHSMPEQVTGEWLTKIGISTPSQAFSKRALFFLGLTDSDGFTTDTARRLQTAGSDQYAAVLEEIIRAAYAPIFKVVDPASSSRTQIDDAFRGEKPEAQRPRMVALFLGLCREAGMTLKEPPQGGRASKSASSSRSTPKTDRTRHPQQQHPQSPPIIQGTASTRQVAQTTNGSALIERLLEKFPAFDPGWSDELKQKWFDGFAKLQDELKK